MRKIFLLLVIVLLIVGCSVQEDKVIDIKETTESIVKENLSNQTEEPTQQVIPVPKNSNLVAHWKFDEKNGKTAKDSANAFDATVIGGSWGDGKIGSAIYLDGIDDYIELPQSALSKISSLSQGTISFWFKYKSLLDKQTVMPIFYLGMDDEKDKDNIFIIEIGHFDENMPGALAPNNKKIYATWIKDNKEPFLCYDSNINLEENKWHHFALVVGVLGNTGYLNGVELQNRNYNFGSAKDTYFLDKIPNPKKIMLGRGRSSYMVGPKFVFYKGYLDDFRIYDKVLTAAEVKKIYVL